jgi:two-component system cell cycle sensor histidine kinase/response regulator CckA
VRTHDQIVETGDVGVRRPGRLRILLTDCERADEGTIREILGRTFAEPAIDVLTTKGELEARLTGDVPDLVLACERGAAISAAEVLEMARELAPRMPVIVYSHQPTEEEAVRAIEQGAADYIHLQSTWEVSVAVKRAMREFEQRQRRKEAEDRLRNHINMLQLQQVVATAANEASNPEDAAQSVLDIMRAYGSFALGHLYYASEEGVARVRASGIWSGYEAGAHEKFRRKSESFDFSEASSVAGMVIAKGEMSWIADISKEPKLVRGPAALEAGLNCVVMAPVAAGAETLGVIEFFGEKKMERDEHLALVIEYVATQLGRVFERDRAERRLETRAREQMVLAELCRKTVDVVNLDEYLAGAVRGIEEVLPGCRCAVLEATPDGSTLRIRARSEGVPEEEGIIPAGEEDDVGHGMMHTDLLKVEMKENKEWKIPDCLRREVGSAITASIRLRNDVFGALIAYSPGRREFSRSEMAFVRGVANVLAAAAEHTAAFHQLQLLGSAVTQSQDAIMITDAELDLPGPRIMFVNPAFSRITGYRVDEVLGLTPRILQGEKTDGDFLRRMHTRLRQGKSAHGETVNYRKNGTEFWVEMQVSPLRNTAGEITHFVGIQRDITERRIAEERLRESEAMLGAAQRLAHLGSWVMEYRSADLGKTLLLWSEEVFRIFGYPPGGVEVTLENFFQRVHPEDREPVRVAFEKARDGHAEYQIEHRIVRPDGVERIVVEQAKFQYDDAGHPVKVLGTAQDITERKEAEEGVRHWKERYEMLTKASGQIIFDLDYVTGRIAYGGDAERVMGCPPESLGNKMEQWIARIHPEDRAHFERELEKQSMFKGIAEIEYRLRRNDGSYITVKDIGYPMLNERGEIARIVGSVTDISAERALEVQLRRSQKMEAFGKLAGGVAHDFNNLLTVITGYNEVMLSELAVNDPKREYIEQIARAANRASTLTSQLLAFSRQQKLQPRVVDLNEVIRDTSKMLARLIGEDISMEVKEGPGLGHVKADVGQIEQVLMNLAVNARDAMHGGGTITMSTRNATIPSEDAPASLPVGEYVALEVTDTGMGMSPETQARIFEPFFTTKPPGQGTGLGLATCYGIVKQSGGEIAVRSKLGTGTTFQIFLPRVYEDLKSYDVPLGPGVLPMGTQNILIVEDELPVRVIMRSILRRLKYTVLEAANGAEAMRILATPGASQVELLITDMVMPEMGGRELARRTRSMFPAIRIIFTSGYPTSPTEEAIPNTRTLQKPFSPKTLAEAVRDALEG